MPIIDPLRIDRAQRALYEVFADALAPASVQWTYSQPSYEASIGPDALTLQFSNGPSQFARKHVRGFLLRPFTSILLRVTAAVAGQRALVNVNNFPFFYDVQPGDTTEIIRDQLVTVLNADVNDPWTATPEVAVDELTITPDPTFFGAIFQMTLSGSLEAVSQVQPGNAVLLVEGTRTFTLSMQAYSKNREPRNGAWSLMSRAQSVFEDANYMNRLYEQGVSSWDQGVAADISAIAGANWESRVTMDAILAMRSNLIVPVDQIENLNVSVTVSGAEGNVIDTTTITVTDPTP